MRVLVALDSFKETCSAKEACAELALGLGRYGNAIQVDECPLADGGEGLIDAVGSIVASLEQVTVQGPLGERLDAPIAWVDTKLEIPALQCEPGEPCAIIEAATCLGLALVPRQRRDPLQTTSHGLGQLIRHAMQRGAKTIVVGLGGTSTVDVGIGMAQALGATFHGVPVPATGGSLGQVSAIDLTGLIRATNETRVLLASDVRNPLLGVCGAARAFAPQKGASPEAVDWLEQSIEPFARKLLVACHAIHRKPSTMPPPALEATKRGRGPEFGCDFEGACSHHGAGAAGGIGFALQQLYGSPVIAGIDWVMDCVGFSERLDRADLVITGEGRLDASSFEGKVVSGVLSRARAFGSGAGRVWQQSD